MNLENCLIHKRSKKFLKSRPDKKNIKNFRRGIYLRENLKKNTIIKENLFNFVRPLNSPNYVDISKFINKKTRSNFKKILNFSIK